MAAVVLAIAHKHTLRFKEQSMPTSRRGFANHLPRIRYFKLKQSRYSLYVWHLLFLFSYTVFFIYVFWWYSPVFTVSALFHALSAGNGIWPFSLFFCLCQLGIITYNALYIFLKTLFLGFSRFYCTLSNPHGCLMSHWNQFLGKLHKMLVNTLWTVRAVTTTLTAI